MYKYDIFVSYKREPPKKQLITPWLIEVLDRIEYWLRQELGGRHIEVFFDQTSIGVGDEWPDKIRQALLSSRCLLAVWSPEYFRSSWCVSEWKSFLARENIYGTKKRLIVPICFHDGIWFPDEARKVQQLDLAPYAGTTRAFWVSPRADELDQKLQQFAPILARAVAEAPEHKPDWPIEMPEALGTPRDVKMSKL